MIRSKIRDKLRERGETYRTVQTGTGLPYATVFAHCSGRAQMMDFRVLNQFCRYLDTTVGDLLEYVPDPK